MKKIYIRFMAEVTELSVEKLFYIVDKAYRDKKTEEVHLLLSTLGGNVKQGIDVYNFLRGIPLRVTTYNFGTTVDQNNIARIVGDTLGKNMAEVLAMMHKRETHNAGAAKKLNLVHSIDQALLPADAYLEVVKESDAFQDMIEPPENRAMRTITTKPYTTTIPYRTIAPRPSKTTTIPYRIITPRPYKTTTMPYRIITPKPYKTTTIPYRTTPYTTTITPVTSTTTSWREATVAPLEKIPAKTFHNNNPPSSVS